MRAEVMEHYGLVQSIEQAGYYETAHHKQLIKDIRGPIREGRLIAVCGVVGSGKTVTLRRLQQQLMDENKIIVARSLSVDKHNARLAMLVESVLSRQLDDLEPTLTRHGYRLKDMVEQFDATPSEIRALSNNQRGSRPGERH